MYHGIDAIARRQPEHDVEDLFVERWSPRAMSGAVLEQATLERLFEAARWAPSAFNAQPWRFVYAHREGAHWAGFMDLLVPGNQSWCVRAAVLMVLLSRHIGEHNGKPAPTHALDCGAAWQNLALQGTRLGLVVHGMAGFDRERAHALVGAPEVYTVQAMIAIGWPGDLALLDEGQREREQPSGRKPVASIACEGRLGADA